MSQYFLCAFHDRLFTAGPYHALCVAIIPDKRSVVMTNNADERCGTSFDVNADLENYVS
jgi:hypothetical protein